MMERRIFQGNLICGNVESEEMRMEVYISTSRGLKTGRGTFDVPRGMVGTIMNDGKLTFRTICGEDFQLLVTRHEIMTGKATFVTSGPVPEMRDVA